MCRLLGFVSASEEQLSHPILYASHSIRAQSLRDRQSQKPNDAGWGYGIWNDRPEIVKRLTKPATDPLFPEMAEKPYRRMLLHIRRASAGGLSCENTHPFLFNNQLIFAHNGTIDRFEKVRNQAIGRLPAHFRDGILGRTDSEYLMYLFLHHLLRGDSPDSENLQSFRLALAQTIATAEQLADEAGAEYPPELNFIFLTKHFLIATKVLYWLGFYEGVRNGLMITSEPVEPGDGWASIGEREMIAVRRDASYELLSLATFKGRT